MTSRFKKGNRVRIKFGIDRGSYGTIRSVGGDDGSYYGVKLDCYEPEVAYSEYELELANDINKRSALWNVCGVPGTCKVYVPKEVAVCPECGGELAAQAMEHEVATGRPTATGIEIDCMNNLRDGGPCHTWYQSAWQPIRDAIAKWCDARVDYGCK